MKNTSNLMITVTLVILCLAAGCDLAPTETVDFEPNYVYAMVVERINDQDDGFMREPLDQVQSVLLEQFGTPDDPKLPAMFTSGDFKDLMSLTRLQMAAGPAASGTTPGERGLYLQFCASCHGESGQGRGTLAASQNPYPREFRKGLFKYKSTFRNAKPTRADLIRSVSNGLAGSQMPVFKEQLNQEQIESVIDYTIYLSIRGEFERKVLMALAAEEDYDVDEILTEIGEAWSDLDERLVEITEPEEAPILGATADVDPDLLSRSIERGKQVFLSEAAACAKCHGELANGVGKQEPEYDDWTKEWTKQIQIEPTDRKEIAKFLAMGALPPQPVPPRNLTEGKFRGGDQPEDIYRRIRQGIAGSPMPQLNVVDDPSEVGVTDEDVWHVVNYVLSLPKTEGSNVSLRVP